MNSYRGSDGSERVWYDDGEIDQIMESELRKASLLPTVNAPAVDVERFIERHLRVALDQYAEMDPSTLGTAEFFVDSPPKITTTTGTYGHLALEDLRDAVTRIGPKNPAPFADSLLTDPARALPALKRTEDLPSENHVFQSEPRGDRTHDPRLKRPVLYQLS